MTTAADGKEAATANSLPNMTVNLQTSFLYQNRQTGQPSSAPLTARQLCRIVCPANKGSNNTPTTTTSIIAPQTLLLGYDPTSHSYDPTGWRCASSIPLLREACASWYYESKGGVKGPVSTRILADLLVNDDTNNNGDEKGEIDEKTRVFPTNSNDSSGSGSGEWTRIQDLANLQLAMEALTEVKSMPESWPSNDNDGNMDQVANMTYDNGDNDNGAQEDNGVTQQKVNDDLEAFLSSTDHLAPHAAGAGAAGDDDESDEEEYESDGGTRYIRDSRTGNWVHEALAPKKEKKKEKKKNGKKDEGSSSSASTTKTAATVGTIEATKKRKKSNKPKFSAKHARNWIYVTGLPNDTNEEEVATYFSKVGIIDLDPETQKPKVKLYRHTQKKGESGDEKSTDGSLLLKGDASIGYARPESVALALQILDENLFRDGHTLSVQRAKFEQHGENKKGGGRRMVSEAKRKVARLAALQAVGWDEGENGRIAGGLKGLRIVVLMNMFDPAELKQDKKDEKLLRTLEKEVHAECEEIEGATVEKITVFSKHPAGVMIVKFTMPNAASDAVNKFNGKVRANGRKVEASYWDGVTDYTCRNVEKEEKEADKRLDAFGDWLENQELPEEFKLKVEE